MKIALLVIRLLLGLVFFVLGLNAFLSFIPAVLPPGLGGQFLQILIQSRYVYFVAGFQVLGGALLLVNRYVPLALTVLGPIIVNILLYHLLLNHEGAVLAIVVAIFWGILVFHLRHSFASLFVQKTP